MREPQETKMCKNIQTPRRSYAFIHGTFDGKADLFFGRASYKVIGPHRCCNQHAQQKHMAMSILFGYGNLHVPQLSPQQFCHRKTAVLRSFLCIVGESFVTMATGRNRGSKIEGAKWVLYAFLGNGGRGATVPGRLQVEC